jgi:hypothetical protein
VVFDKRSIMSNNDNHNSSSASASSASSHPPGSSSSSSYVSNYGIELQWPAQIMTAASNSNKDPTASSSSSSTTTATTTLQAKAVAAVAAAAAAQQSSPRTSNELLQHRMLEAGILYDVPVSLGQVAETCHHFVADLERTGCFHSVQVEIGQAPLAPPVSPSSSPSGSTKSAGTTTHTTDSSQQQQQQLRVFLDEKKWYRLHVGAGLKTSDWSNSNSSMFSSPVASGSDVLQQATQVEASFGLRNLTGCLDQTDFHYTVDLKQTASFQATHERPLYTFLPSSYGLRNALLLLPRGSQWTCSSQLAVQTLDFEWMRSYKEFQRLASLRISNQHSIPPPARSSLCTSPEQSSAQLHSMLLPPQQNSENNNVYWGLEWNSMIRDIVPRRDDNARSHSVFAMQASPQVVAQAGSTVKHSITGLVRKPVPTSGGGLGGHGLIEMALPTQLLPGDNNSNNNSAQFVKYHAGLQGRWPLLSTTAAADDDDDNNNNLTLHGSFQAGFLQSWSGGGVSRKQQQSSNTAAAIPHQQQPPTLSDRFYVGGPGQFRGFLPGGIGPRATKKSSSSSSSSLLTPGGDALGGDFYYTATAVLSAPLILPAISSDSSSSTWPFRCFGFCTMGTCIGNVLETPVSSILKSSRLSAGVGVATTVGAMGGLPRIELTYAWPLRYGPHDARRNFQWAIGISID